MLTPRDLQRRDPRRSSTGHVADGLNNTRHCVCRGLGHNLSGAARDRPPHWRTTGEPMTLNDDHIRSLVASDGLIRGHEPRNVQNCGCMLTAGTVFSPDTGREVPLGSGSTETQHFWELPPSETLIVMTREIVKMPTRLWASYGPLNRHARSGVMLLNPAIVEPCYEGPLSCFLLNFSSKRVQIARGEPISKILFHELDAPPSDPAHMQIDRPRRSSVRSRAHAN